MPIEDHRIIFPRAFALGIDDLGWREGSNLSVGNFQGPFRVGVKRTFDINDYRCIADVGKAVGVRIQCLFVLSEMDRENVLRAFPTTTFMREKWNNGKCITDVQYAVMNYVKDNAAHIEFGFHGIGHEYWPERNVMKRAEWYNIDDREPWPEESLRGHISAFSMIMSQYGIDKQHGHSFPESFVPCACAYYWNPTGLYSLGKLLSEVGVKYASTDFDCIAELDPPKGTNGGGFDFGVHVINRRNYGNSWHQLAMLPQTPIELHETDIIESHWSNWLAQDDFLQHELSSKWIAYYKKVQSLHDRYVAINTEQLHSQWLYRKHTVVSQSTPGIVDIDNTLMPMEPYAYNLLGNMVLKIKLDLNTHISAATLNGRPIPAYHESEGFGLLYLPVLSKSRYQLRYELGQRILSPVVINNSTNNIYDMDVKERMISLKVRCYGNQILKVRCPKPKSVVPESSNITVGTIQYDAEREYAEFPVSAKDMQGSTGKINLILI